MVIKYLNHEPSIHPSCYVSETAQIVGRVVLKENANVWFGSVLRGDGNYIEVGANTNIQDNSVVLILETAVSDNDTITISYTKGAKPIKDLENRCVANLINEPVINILADIGFSAPFFADKIDFISL